jgi:hypothetical protein
MKTLHGDPGRRRTLGGGGRIKSAGAVCRVCHIAVCRPGRWAGVRRGLGCTTVAL